MLDNHVGATYCRWKTSLPHASCKHALKVVKRTRLSFPGRHTGRSTPTAHHPQGKHEASPRFCVTKIFQLPAYGLTINEPKTGWVQLQSMKNEQAPGPGYSYILLFSHAGEVGINQTHEQHEVDQRVKHTGTRGSVRLRPGADRGSSSEVGAVAWGAGLGGKTTRGCFQL